MEWTEEKIEQITQLWADGLSCTQVGALMGITRSAVIGKVHRLNLPARSPRINGPAAEQRKFKKAQQDLARKRLARMKKREGSMPPIDREPLPEYIGALNIPMADLEPFSTSRPNQCRFIAAEPPGPDYRACANETLPGESYCEFCKDNIIYNRLALTQEERARRVRLGIRAFHSAAIKALGTPREDEAA